MYSDNNTCTGPILSILANRRRRIFIRYLGDNDTVELKEIADIIADITDTSEKSAYSSLNQTHVPKMKRAEIIKQSNGTKTYVTAENYDRAKLILDYCDQL